MFNTQNIKFNSYKFKKNFKILGSAHNISELNIKKVQRINGIFISPVFKKKTNQALGIHRANNLLKNYKINKIALGGINNKNIKLLRRYLSDTGKILPSRITSVSQYKQRELSTAIKRAKILGLI